MTEKINSPEKRHSKPWGQMILAVVLFVGAGYLLFVDIPPVVLSWETASEVGTAGFNVYRAEFSTAEFVQVNEDLIPAQGDEVLGAAYRYEDYEVSPIKRYQYRIGEVEWNGAHQLYPDTVMVRAGLTRPWRQLEGGGLLVLALALLWWSWKKR
jgi:hypothetical protein